MNALLKQSSSGTNKIFSLESWPAESVGSWYLMLLAKRINRKKVNRAGTTIDRLTDFIIFIWLSRLIFFSVCKS